MNSTTEAADFRRCASLYGLRPSDLGRPFELDGQRYTIVGLSRDAATHPLLARRERDGRVCNFSPWAVVSRLLAGDSGDDRAMKIRIEIEVSDAAFAGDCGPELKRIFDGIKHRIGDAISVDEVPDMVIVDAKGNRVGELEVLS